MIIHVWLTFDITIVLQTKKFKPIANGNITDSGFSQIKAKHNLTEYLMYLCYFFFYLYKYLKRFWAN